MNPSVTHNPVFQVMVGDEAVDLTSRFPVPCSKSWAGTSISIGSCSSSADFFEFCVSTVFEYLFGWDYTARRSSEKGGILGHLRAFYGTCEFTERDLCMVILIWLLGGSNPNEIHRRLREEPGFELRFFVIFEDIIQHHLPDVEISTENTMTSVERPPVPPRSVTGISAKPCMNGTCSWNLKSRNWVRFYNAILGKPVCHKYGNENKCVSSSHMKSFPNSHLILTPTRVLKCLDGMVNYFNRTSCLFQT